MNDSVIDTEDLDDSSIHSTSSSATEHIVPDIEESTNGWKQVPEKQNKKLLNHTLRRLLKRRLLLLYVIISNKEVRSSLTSNRA